MNSARPMIAPNSQYLVEARLVAESDDFKFWVLGEIAGRQAQLGESERLNETLGNFAGNTAEERVAIVSWREKAEKIAVEKAKVEADHQAEVKGEFVGELERRVALAQERQDEQEATSLQQLIEAVKTKKNDQ